MCRHHAAVIADGCGTATEFTCPYHGWCYGNDGKLLKANKLFGIKNFRQEDNGLKPIQVDSWGPFIFLCFGDEKLPPVSETHKEVLDPVEEFGRLDKLKHVKRRDYPMECNWKVFCDNYLDGGYHVPYAHKALADGIDMESY